MRIINKQSGFTLIEIMIAMAVFSMSIIIITISFVGLVRSQRTATEDRATQQNARVIIEDIVRDIRAASSVSECVVNGKQALLVNKETAVIYYPDSDNKLIRGTFTAGTPSCTPPASSETLTSRFVTVREFVRVVIADAPTPADLKSRAVDVKLVLTSGNSNSATTMHTIGSTRGAN